MKDGFVNTGKTARLWWGPLQIQVWRMDYTSFLIAWNGRRFSFAVQFGQN